MQSSTIASRRFSLVRTDAIERPRLLNAIAIRCRKTSRQRCPTGHGRTSQQSRSSGRSCIHSDSCTLLANSLEVMMRTRFLARVGADWYSIESSPDGGSGSAASSSSKPGRPASSSRSRERFCFSSSRCLRSACRMASVRPWFLYWSMKREAGSSVSDIFGGGGGRPFNTLCS
uniref:Uncharacterized protein n=1 Tax=Anopheles quadriannulatus TaxID=34691 RepID=A0A182X4P0_ANOQN